MGKIKIVLPPDIDELPVVALKNTALFPHQFGPVQFSRSSSVEAINKYRETSGSCNYILVTAQKDSEIQNPTIKDLFTVGTIAEVIKIEKGTTENGAQYTLTCRGISRVSLEFTQEDPYFSAKFEILEDQNDEFTEELEQVTADLREKIVELADITPGVDIAAKHQVSQIKDPSQLADTSIARLGTSLKIRQEILEEVDVDKRVHNVLGLVTNEVEVQKLRLDVQEELRSETEKQARRIFLHEQKKRIEKELGEEEESDDLEKLEELIESCGMPEVALKAAKKELTKLKRTPSISSDWGVSRTYLDWLVEMPWEKSTEDNLDIPHAQEILDEGHFGLHDPKKRILEFLAVRKLKEDNKGPILCFVGPPGVGKTTLAKSIAKALGRKCERISLGGIYDESEIRGHRRTYVGALPGKIITAMKRVGTKNPVFVLDEVDKVGNSHRGDPSSALLEVLDPEQNNEFVDHYLEVPFDLSEVMFICTANSTDTIQAALKDRMEVIEISSYTEEEKLEIAKRHLIAKERKNNGLKKEELSISDHALKLMIAGYTREAGVRKLQQTIAKSARQVAVKLASGKRATKKVTNKNLENFIGKQKFFREIAEESNPPGVVTGLAWTPVGGTILFAEATKHEGKGELQITGLLGDSMEESAKAAMTYIKANAEKLGITTDFSSINVHIHFPDGIQKDGPSAGITQVIALVSLFLGIPVPGNIGMTGEISFRGRVLQIGGLKEKLLAAIRAGVKIVYVPKKNEHDLSELDKDILDKLDIRLVETIDEVVEGIFNVKNLTKEILLPTSPLSPPPVNAQCN